MIETRNHRALIVDGPAPVANSVCLPRVALGPYSGFACPKTGILWSDDGGRTFLSFDLPNGDHGVAVAALKPAIGHPGTFVISYLRSTGDDPDPHTVPELMITADQGESWRSFDWPQSFGAVSLAVDASGKFLYAATQEGVFVTQILPNRGPVTLSFR